MTYVINDREVNVMPRKDGTGPMGAGLRTGKGLGVCTGIYGARIGTGLGRGHGRGFVVNKACSKTQKELLQEQKDILQNRLEFIDQQLENL